jgi:hypothetical protein
MFFYFRLRGGNQMILHGIAIYVKTLETSDAEALLQLEFHN